MMMLALLSPVFANTPAWDTDPTAVPEEWRCPVTVDRVLEDAAYRGHPMTPAHADMLRRLSPEQQQMYRAESHAESYRQCAYAVTVSGQAWRFTETWSTLLGDKPADWCAQATEEVAALIQRTTRGCTDLHAGAYYGHDLVPLQAAKE